MFNAMHSKRVLLITPLPPPNGGIANWSRLLKNYAAKHDSDAFIIFDSSIRGRSRFQVGFLRRIFFHLPAILKQFGNIFNLIVSRDFEVVHVCSSAGFGLLRDIFVVALSKLMGVRCILHLHFGRTPRILSQSNFESLLLRLTFHFVSVIIAIDEETYLSLKALFPRKEIYNIPNAVDIECVASCDDKQRIVVFSGWVVRNKGIEELLTVWERLSSSGWELLLVGPFDALYMNELKARFCFNSVHVVGEVGNAEMLSIFRKSMIMCLPSYTEGFPFAVLEAMACGCAVVSTEVGAVPQMLSGDSGIVVAPKDADALFDAINSLMSDESRINELSLNATRKVAESYHLDVIYPVYKVIWGQH